MRNLTDITHEMEVDGITSVFGYSDDPEANPSIYRRQLFALINDHPDDNCPFCTGYTSLAGGMYWRKGEPIVRFTSEGMSIT